ncbi:MAG: hypothetical protein AAFX06_15035 [Planctomycetota bacterium]
MSRYFVRVGALGEIVVATAIIPFSRRRRVVLRSKRGIEIAEIVGPCSHPMGEGREPAFRILRPTTDSDERLAERLGRHKREAVEACRSRLTECGSTAVLLDVDQFLDGGTLKLHFLGEIDSATQSIADEVARQYEEVVKTDHLSELLQAGCGTGCGTDQSGCGSCLNCWSCSTNT